MKDFARRQLTLATQCTKEFMSGYREGRDLEVDRMLHEYFQDFDSEKSDEKQKKEQETQAPAKRKGRRRAKKRSLRD